MESENGFRNKMKEKLLREGLTSAEISRIEEQRKFNELKPKTFSWMIAVHLDSIRRMFREKDNLLSKRLWNIENLNNNIKRCLDEIKSGNISTEVSPGLKMNVTELKTHIKYQEWLIIGEVRSIPEILAEIRAIVGHKDVLNTVVMSEEQFDKYVENIQVKLREQGYDLFS